MPRPKKTVEGRSGMNGDADKKIKKPKAIKEKVNPNVRIKKVKMPKTPVVREEIGIKYDPEAENFTACSMFLHLNAVSGTAEIAYQIPAKTITIKMTRIHFKTLASAQTYPAVGLILNVISPLQINSNLSTAPIPLISSYTGVDVSSYPNIQLTIGRNVNKRIEYRIIDITTGNTIPADAFDFCQIWIEYIIISS